MDEKISIEIFNEKSDLEQIISFLDKELPFDYSVDTFKWEYSDQKMTFGYLTDHTNAVLGTQGMIPINLFYGNRKLASAKSETSYLSAKTKGKGLFQKLYAQVVKETFNKKTSLIWGFTSLGDLWEKKLGFNVQRNELRTYSIALSPKISYYFSKEQEGNKTKQILRYLKACKDATIVRFKSKQNKNKALNFSEKLLNKMDLQRYFERLKVKNPNLVHLDMDETYLNYRIHNNPFLAYITQYLYNAENDLIGYYILSHKNGISNLVDLNSDTKEFKRILLDHAIKTAKESNSARLNLLGNKSNNLMQTTFNLFSAYKATSFDSPMCIVTLANEQLDLNFSDWYINGLWTEGIDQ